MDGLGRCQLAVKLDPELCAAQLRLAAFGTEANVNQRVAFDAARHCSTSFGGRDRALLDAIAPGFASPPDSAAVVVATERAVREFPDDPEILLLRAIALAAGTDPAAAINACDHATRLDPQFVQAYNLKAEVLLTLRRSEEAESTLAACDLASPGSVRCASSRADLFVSSGRCGEIERLAQTFIQERPSSWAGYDYLARALVARHAPVEAVEAALDQELDRLTPGTTEHYRARILRPAAVKVAYGDFAGALTVLDQSAREDTKLLEASSMDGFLLRLGILVEAGRSEEARALVRTFLRSSEAFITEQSRDDYVAAIAKGGRARSTTQSSATGGTPNGA
jgi:tetratricopeptide (TPR) repeat protein